MRNEDKHLVQALHDVSVRPDGTRVFSAELRQRAVAWYRAKRAQGVACCRIGDALGIHPVLMASWARREQNQGFRQIELLGGASPQRPAPGRTGGDGREPTDATSSTGFRTQFRLGPDQS